MVSARGCTALAGVVLALAVAVPAATASPVPSAAASREVARSPARASAAELRTVAVRRAGTAPAAGTVSATVVLSPPDRAGLARLADTTGLPLAARQAQLAALAPTAQTRRAMQADLSARGLSVVGADAWSLLVSGPASAVERAFGVTLLAVDGATYPDRAPTLPGALAGAVTAVVGLDSRPVMHRRAVPAGFAPSTLRAAYQVPDSSSSGAGATIGSLQLSGWDAGNLAVFAQAAGIPLLAAQYQPTGVDGMTPSRYDPADGGHGEVSLDQEALLGAAPAAVQAPYFAPNSTRGVQDAYDRMASDAAAGRLTAVSTSWGACEPQYDRAALTALHDTLTRLVAAGTPLFAASGDAGAYDCAVPGAPSTTPAVDYPASDPVTVGVGGTSLTVSGGTAAETAWSNTSQRSGTGGGQSGVFARPTYQRQLSQPGTGRLVPDLSAVADPRTGIGIYDADEGGWEVVGGTSAAAPLVTGQYVAALSSLGCTAGRGDLHTGLYGAAGTAGLYDVTAGDNLRDSAAPGYDLATGLGSPRWQTLAGALTPAGGCPDGTFTPLLPYRLVDTRGRGAVGPGASLAVQVTGVGGVPASGVSAVVLNLTGTGPTASTYLTAYPTGAALPTASNLNLPPGATRADLVTVPVGSGGRVSVFNYAGSVQVVADVAGYYSGGSGAVAARFVPLTPTRVFDTRSAGKVGAGQTISPQVAGVGGVPGTDTVAVAMTVTATEETRSGFLTVYPSGSSRPTASTLNFVAGATTPNAVAAKLGPDGRVSIFSSAGDTHVLGDVVGYWTAGPLADTRGTRFHATQPTRIIDTRRGLGATPAPAGPAGTVTTAAVGVGPLPAGEVSAVVLTVTAVAPTGSGYLTVYPGGAARPTASNLNFVAGQTVADLVTVPVGSDGTITFFNAAGSTHVLADVVGWYDTPR